jgi:hypothetical protein
LSLALFLGVGFSAAAQEYEGLTIESPLFGRPSVGNASIVVRTVTGSLDGSVSKLRLQDDIYHNELIETFEDSATELAFLDETTINLGPNSIVVLDEFVYDPDPSNSSFILTVTQGALRFTSGVLPSDAYKINTPVATIGIRGTIVELLVDEELQSDGSRLTRVSLMVVDGEADLIGCDGTLTTVASGQSTSILGSAAGCSETGYN